MATLAEVRTDRLEAIYYDSFKLPEARHNQREWVSGTVAPETFELHPDLAEIRDRESLLRGCRDLFIRSGLTADLVAWYVMGPQGARDGLQLSLCFEGREVNIERTDVLDAGGAVGHAMMAKYLGLNDFVTSELFRGTRTGSLAETREILRDAIKFCKRYRKNQALALTVDHLYNYLRRSRA